MKELKSLHVKHGNVLKPEDFEKATDIETETQPEVKPERYTKSDEPSQAPQVACTEASNENTSDAQPLAESCHGLPLTRAHLSNEAATLLETLSDVAESEHNGEAANMLLQGIHGYPHEVRNMRDLAKITEKLLGIRQRIVTLMAVQECSRDPRWSQEQWRQWINSFSFDRRMMNDAIDIWRDQIFVDDMSEITRQKEEMAQTHGQRREIRRGAFRAWQKEQYGQAAIAKIFVKFPVTNLAELLEDWQTYISSMEYTEQRLRNLPKISELTTVLLLLQCPRAHHRTAFHCGAAGQDTMRNWQSCDIYASKR